MERESNAIKRGPTLSEFKGEFLDRYARVNNKPSEVESKATILRRHLVPAFGHLRLGDIRRREIDAYKANKREAGLKPGTINNQLGVLSKLLKVAVAWELIESAPAVGLLKNPKPQFDYLDFDDRRRSFRVKAAGLEHLSADGLLDHLGVTHVLLADKTPGDGRLDHLVAPELGWLDPLTGQVGPVPAPLTGLEHHTYWPPGHVHFDSRDPFGPDPDGRVVEAKLPTELDRAGASIWQVDRAGPALYLFERGPAGERP